MNKLFFKHVILASEKSSKVFQFVRNSHDKLRQPEVWAKPPSLFQQGNDAIDSLRGTWMVR